MSKRNSRRNPTLSESLRKLGEIQVCELDFVGLMHKDIRDLEISRTLRRLGNVQVTEWDFKTVLPAVNKLAQKEVDLVDLVKRAAAYKVMEWDFRSAPSKPANSLECRLTQEEMQDLIVRLKDFLQYVVANLIDKPDHAQIKVQQIETNVLRFKLVLLKRDAAMLIGKEGHTASAIRGILKATARIDGVHALLQIHSHEEEAAFVYGEMAPAY